MAHTKMSIKFFFIIFETLNEDEKRKTEKRMNEKRQNRDRNRRRFG